MAVDTKPVLECRGQVLPLARMSERVGTSVPWAGEIVWWSGVGSEIRDGTLMACCRRTTHRHADACCLRGGSAAQITAEMRALRRRVA